MSLFQVAFIGGGNMAAALIGGLLQQGHSLADIQIIEPSFDAKTRLLNDFKFNSEQIKPSAGSELNLADVVVWAVKPQVFKDATLSAKQYVKNALHLSVAAGIQSQSIANWLETERVVRAMPNTPALIGKGIAGLFARAAVQGADKNLVECILKSTGAYLWLENEKQLDAVTALSGSGPAYVFYFLEAMIEAGLKMGLSHLQARQLACETFVGASELAKFSSEAPDILRERVTSKGGTTHAALMRMNQYQMKEHFIEAIEQARLRAEVLGQTLDSDA